VHNTVADVQALLAALDRVPGIFGIDVDDTDPDAELETRHDARALRGEHSGQADESEREAS